MTPNTAKINIRRRDSVAVRIVVASTFPPRPSPFDPCHLSPDNLSCRPSARRGRRVEVPGPSSAPRYGASPPPPGSRTPAAALLAGRDTYRRRDSPSCCRGRSHSSWSEQRISSRFIPTFQGCVIISHRRRQYGTQQIASGSMEVPTATGHRAKAMRSEAIYALLFSVQVERSKLRELHQMSCTTQAW